jgi:type II secretory pathway predicted ATPase ExeA
MKRAVLIRFGLSQKGHYQSRVWENTKRSLRMAIEDNQMIAVVGEAGAGKSYLLAHTLREMQHLNPIVVYVRNFYKEKLTIANIINAILLTNAISQEGLKRDMEARSIQVARVLGEKAVNEKRRIVVVIEEAHRVHANTFRALKELRETQFAGYSPLFSTVLLGHSELASKLKSRNEVYWRTDMIELNESKGWMNYPERVDYLKQVYGDALTPGAREMVAGTCSGPLEMDVYVQNKMEESYYGTEKTQLDEMMMEMSLAQMKDKLNLSLADIATATGLSRSTVHNTLRNEDKHKTTVREAMQALASKREAV